MRQDLVNFLNLLEEVQNGLPVLRQVHFSIQIEIDVKIITEATIAGHCILLLWPTAPLRNCAIESSTCAARGSELDAKGGASPEHSVFYDGRVSVIDLLLEECMLMRSGSPPLSSI